MSRSSILPSSAMLLFVASGSIPAIAAAEEATQTRAQIVLNSGWRFALDDSPGDTPPNWQDFKGDAINLPHTWNARDGQDGGGDYRRGGAWYLRTFIAPKGAAAGRLFLRVGAANSVARAYLNGMSIGEHKGGYSAFVFELTDTLKWGERNELAIWVSNAPNNDIPPYSADFTFFGGIYRDVSLILTPKVCISPLDHAASGVFVSTDDIGDTEAHVNVRVLLSSASAHEQPVRLQVEITDRDNRVVAKADEASERIPPGESSRQMKLTVPNPRLWNGKTDPHLYTANVSLYLGATLLDTLTEHFGIRTFRLDAERGFFLNGKPYPLHGVNRHQDRVDRGWAVTKKHHREDLVIIREMGCTVVRLAHYQQDPYVYELCDRLGLVAWAEIPLVNRVFDTPAFKDNCKQQLRELIRQNFNHPSICFWGVHNEVTAPWEPGPDATPLVKELAALVKQEDPKRISVCAGTSPDDHSANWQTEGVAFNRYFGWYHDDAKDIGAWLDRMHQEHPNTPLAISEYGAGGSILQHELSPRKPKHDGAWHPEEYQAVFHEVHWRELESRPYLWGTFIWNMFDFASDGRREGDSPGRNDKGIVSYDRRTRKDAFYWYKANWTDEPFVYITSRRFTDRKAIATAIKVYSNCPTVELQVGDAHYPSIASDRHMFEWKGVTLKPGNNTIRVSGKRSGRTVTDSCIWRYTPPDEVNKAASEDPQ